MSTDHLIARFYDHPRLNVAESRSAGHKVYDTVLMVELRNRGERGESFSELVKGGDVDKTEYYRAAFPGPWSRYKGGNTDGLPTSGHLLSVLGLELGEIQMLEGLDIRTVETLSTLNDGAVMKIRGGLNMKAQAIKWLATQDAIKSGNVIDMLDEMKARIAQLETENASLAEKRKPGRPKKEDVDGHVDATATM
jgi:hypothetical protein